MAYLNLLKRFRFSLHVIILLLGIIATMAAILWMGAAWKMIVISIGTTLIASSLVAILYQTFGVSEFSEIGDEIKKALAVYKDTTKAGIIAVYLTRGAIPDTIRTDFIQNAKCIIWLYGMAELGAAENRRTLFLDLARKGVKIHILLLNHSSIATQIDREEGGNGSGLPGRIARAQTMFLGMKNTDALCKANIQIRTYDAYPQVNIVRVDDKMLITPYIRYQPGDMCMTFNTQNVPEGMFCRYADHFEKMWSFACEASLTNR